MVYFLPKEKDFTSIISAAGINKKYLHLSGITIRPETIAQKLTFAYMTSSNLNLL